MILQALTDYYETLMTDKKVAGQGWCQAKTAFALDLSAEGKLKGVISLKQEVERGKKKVWIPSYRMMPQMETRSSGVKANFLCDNSKYILGIDSEGSGNRIQECFEASKEKHLKILENANSEIAQAIKSFFCMWNPQEAKENEKIQEIWDEITEGSNIIFTMNGNEAQNDEEICAAWEKFLKKEKSGIRGICLVTGKEDEITRIHTFIKGIQGAQSAGASLVAFNASAFESYEKQQGYNASIGKYAAFAYTTALNYLLSQRDYVFQFGDTTVVFWAENGEEIYQDIFSYSIEPQEDNQELIKNVFQNLKEHRVIDIDGIKLNEDQKFYILGLAPNAARLSIRFFYQNSFGNILENIQNHYFRMNLVKPSWERREYLGVGSMLYETVNQKSRDKKPVPNLSGTVIKSILANTKYPEILYGNVIMRIRAEQGRITWGRAAIIKAFLIQNYHLEKGEEFVGLNQETNDTAYVLGRMFAVLESIQEEANPGINATIKDKYFNAACANPVSVFPVLIKLKNSHIRKIERQKERKKIFYEKLLTELAGKIMKFPKRLTLEEQGQFILGYYHQVQKRYEKKEEE